MALRLDDKYTFYHIPKTGGESIRQFMRQFSPNIKEVIGKEVTHDILKAKSMAHKHCNPLHISDHDKELSFTSIRHPLTYYQSIYKSKLPYSKNTYLNAYQTNDNFDQFVNQVLRIHPYGYVTRLYLSFIPFCKFILRLENLEKEIYQLFENWGYKIRKPLTKINISKLGDLYLSDKTLDYFYKIEKPIMRYLNYEVL